MVSEFHSGDQAKLEPVAVTITGGDTVSRDGRDYQVPKRDLVSPVQVLLDCERLKIARSLPEAQTLIDETFGLQGEHQRPRSRVIR